MYIYIYIFTNLCHSNNIVKLCGPKDQTEQWEDGLHFQYCEGV